MFGGRHPIPIPIPIPISLTKQIFIPNQPSDDGFSGQIKLKDRQLLKNTF
jgi:hypothetical protein